MPTFLTPLNLTQQEIQNAVAQNLASAPSSPKKGQFYMDTVSNTLFWYSGSSWVAAQGSSPSFAAPGSSAVGDAIAAGVSTSGARADHVHGREAFGTPGSSAVGDAAAAGTAVTVAHSDHVHGREAFGNVVAQTAFGASSANGTATTEARADHAHGTPTHVDADHSAIHLNALAAPTAAVSMAGQKITNGADPTSATDFATKQYVDAAAVGIDFKPSVKAATTAALGANTYANGASGVGATLTSNTNVVLPAQDGYTPVLNDRLLVKNEATGANNGIYTVTAVGSGAAPWVLTRATDSDTAAELNAGALVYVEQGTVAGAEQWVMTTTGAIVVGTTGITWTQFSGASTLTAGAGLTATGNVFAVGAGAGITVAADSVAIDTAVVTRKFAGLVGDGASTSIVVTHNLGTADVVVALYAAATPFAEVIADVQHTSTNTITLIFAAAPASNAYRCVVHG